MHCTNIVTWHSANHTSASHDCYCTYGHKLHGTQLCPITWTIISCDHTHTRFSCVTPMAPSPLETVEHLILHLLPNHLLCYFFHLLISYIVSLSSNSSLTSLTSDVYSLECLHCMLAVTFLYLQWMHWRWSVNPLSV